MDRHQRENISEALDLLIKASNRLIDAQVDSNTDDGKLISQMISTIASVGNLIFEHKNWR